MNIWDFVILGLVALAVAGALLSIHRRRRRGKSSCGCGCGCEGCSACEKAQRK
ncbi:MAG: FeoB-associated Cys-rich membrane protein [Spirochaetales bacterium]|nr:FeoB-associated Cys-rich membrane protein [Spirochaetales bacterium]